MVAGVSRRLFVYRNHVVDIHLIMKTLNLIKYKRETLNFIIYKFNESWVRLRTAFVSRCILRIIVVKLPIEYYNQAILFSVLSNDMPCQDTHLQQNVYCLSLHCLLLQRSTPEPRPLYPILMVSI